MPDLALRTSLTSKYELLSLRGLELQLPTSAEVHLFGRNAEFTEGIFAGNLTTKIATLASLLGEEVRHGQDDFLPNDFGDNGLDVIAWLPSGDDQNGRVTMFGQCACTPEWVTKQSSSSDDAWYEVMSVMSRPVNLCFIPYDFRRPDGRWYKKASVRRSVVVDRSRLMSWCGAFGTRGLPKQVFEPDQLDLPTMEDLILKSRADV